MKSSWSQGKDCGWKEKWSIRKASITGIVIGAMESCHCIFNLGLSLHPYFNILGHPMQVRPVWWFLGCLFALCELSILFYPDSPFLLLDLPTGKSGRNIHTFHSKPFWGDGTQSPMHSRQTLYHWAISAALFSVFHSLADSPPSNFLLTPSFSLPPVRLKVTINGCKDWIGQQSFFHMFLYAGQVRVL